MNNAINNTYYPKEWKKSIIIPILKPGKDPTNPYNYRPISLLPNISKIFEKIIKEIIINTTNELKILNENQFGFRKKHGSVHAINKLISDICWNINKKECVGAILTDIKDAFTSVWSNGLIYKLVKYKFPIKLIKIIKNMITDKTFFMHNKGIYSEKQYNIKNGLQQGTITSPILFILFINEIMNIINNFKNNNNTGIAFADDIIIYTSNKNIDNLNLDLQKLYNIIQNYISTWKLSINYEKCELILFRDILKNCHNSVRKKWKKLYIKENNSNKYQIKIVKYLGINLTNNLNYTKHILI